MGYMGEESTFAVILMGPMGSGKTTIGELLSAELGWKLYDADDYHPVENKKKMADGIPLDDNDRAPWLRILKTIIEDSLSQGQSMILACSALKEKYRDLLGVDQKQVFSLFLKGSRELLTERIEARSHEYMNKDLLTSQLATLEEPDTGFIVDISGTPDQVIDRIRSALKQHKLI